MQAGWRHMLTWLHPRQRQLHATCRAYCLHRLMLLLICCRLLDPRLWGSDTWVSEQRGCPKHVPHLEPRPAAQMRHHMMRKTRILLIQVSMHGFRS
jgi:hypothetical protein